jgi:hypothetical protein
MAAPPLVLGTGTIVEPGFALDLGFACGVVASTV